MSSVELEISSGVATITLARPDRLNAMNLELAEQLRSTVTEVGHSGDVEVVVIAARGRAFCAGGDLGEMSESGDPAAYLTDLTREVHFSIASLRELEVPVLAVVQGAVAGGGIGLMLSADVVVCADAATFTPGYGALGLSPDCGATYLLSEAIGRRRAREFFLLGRTIDAPTALGLGMVSQITSPEHLDARRGDAVARLRGAGREANRATTRLLRGDGADLRRVLGDEAAAIVALAGTSSVRGRIAAFLSPAS